VNGHKFFHRPSNLWNIFDLPLNCRVEGFRAQSHYRCNFANYRYPVPSICCAIRYASGRISVYK